MNIGYLIPTISRNAGGVSESLNSLTRYLNYESVSTKIHCMSDEYTKQDILKWDNSNITTHDRTLKNIFPISTSMKKDFLEQNFDLIHNHGIWTYPDIVATKWVNKYCKPYLLSPHGMLDPWAVKNSKLKKKLAYLFYEKNNLNKVTCFHALCESEANAIRNFGIKKPIAIIPNGIDLMDEYKLNNLITNKRSRNNKKKKLLYLGRLHHKKGIYELIQAWCKSSAIQNDWELIIAGWNQGEYGNKLKSYIEQNKLINSVFLVGPVFNEEKEDLFLKSDAFILPSYSEGFPISVLEAWSYKLPVLMTKECNIPQAFINNSAIEIKNDIDELINSLLSLNQISQNKLVEIGTNGYLFAKSDFNWEDIAKKMKTLYGWLLKKNEKPEFIYLK